MLMLMNVYIMRRFIQDDFGLIFIEQGWLKILGLMTEWSV